MTRRLLIIATLGLAVTTSACGSSAHDTAARTEDAVAVVDSVGGLRDAVEVAAAAPGQADAAACDLDRRTLESAVEMFDALNGAPPTTETDLLDQQLITELSPRFDIAADGRVVPSPAGVCT